MKKRIRRKSGFTLTELVIVLLLLTVMTAMVISFTVLVNGYANQSTNRVRIAEEIQNAELVVRHWISSFDTKEGDVHVNALDEISATTGGDINTRYTIAITENESGTRRIEASYPDGNPRYAYVEYIYGVRFVERRDATTGRTLLYCTFTYIMPGFTENHSDTVEEHTFLITTRIA